MPWGSGGWQGGTEINFQQLKRGYEEEELKSQLIWHNAFDSGFQDKMHWNRRGWCFSHCMYVAENATITSDLMQSTRAHRMYLLSPGHISFYFPKTLGFLLYSPWPEELLNENLRTHLRTCRKQLVIIYPTLQPQTQQVTKVILA